MKQIEKFNQTLFVSLGSQIDIERFCQYSLNVQFEELSKPRDFIYYQIKSLKDASELCKRFIKYFNLGSSSWIGGRVIDNENNFIAQISYNGRVWESENYPCKEIEL
ncbi:MAG: hypothetical protein GX793_03630 [Bacteroidales bacterium]|jgi:hypothetical protein|nr:hypothetical protein [Bacteroidales bacterium]MCK9498253.1 hypothetical protein [Bacteroidales bacterium]MDY0313453.1 hypothetical protein [Bacteroidales bacterium]NLB86133.1 hypothetical protein [Bacteroidales bacterium]